MKPEQDKAYVCNGFLIRVDFVTDGQVHVSRWPLDRQAEWYPRKIRVPLDVWEKEMSEAQEEKS